MTTKLKRIIAALAALAALALGGAAIAGATGGDDDSEDDATELSEQATGAEAERAAQAAIKAVGGGEAVEVEHADDGATGYEVEVQKPDGGLVEVNLDSDLSVVSTGEDD